MTKSYKNSSGKSRKRKYNSLFLGIGIGTAIVFSVLIITFIFLLNLKKTEDDIVISEDIPVQEEVKNPEPSDGLQAPEEEPVSYPMPEYNFMLEEVYVPIEGISKEYTLAWVSDLHLIPEEDSNISPSPKLKTRYETLSVTEEGIHAEDLWPEVVKCLNYGDYDAVIFGGDMMDYCSEDNMALFREGYDNLRYEQDQILYIRADHDYGAWYVGSNFTQRDIYDLHEKLDGDDLEKKYLDMDEFILIGINNSTKNITEENFSIVEKLYEKAAADNKPVIAVTHVPYGSNVDDSLKELSMEVRMKPYYWVGPDYQPDDTMWHYLDLIFREDTQVKQVLAGHLHAPWDGQITDQLREHIFSPAFSGVIGVIHIVPADSGIEAKTESHRLRPDEDKQENENTEDEPKPSGQKETDNAPADTKNNAGPTVPVTPPNNADNIPQPPGTPPSADADTAPPADPSTGTGTMTTPDDTPPAADTQTDPGNTPPAPDIQPPPDSTPPAADTQADSVIQQ